MQKKGREKFASRMGFILVSAGCAVGLGNVWKFPYICGINGGAIFILLYLFCLLLLGLPILICEFAVGRGSGKSIGSALRELSPQGTRWKVYRWFPFMGNYLLMMFYTMVAGWMLYYLYIMAAGKINQESSEAVKETFEQLLASPQTMLAFTFLVVAMCIGVCALGVQNGVEKISKVMMTLLIVLMVVMAINSLVLKNSEEGLKFYLVPNFEHMKERGFGNIFFDAMTHAFFTLSVGMGSMAIFGSYLTKERRLTGEALHVTFLDTAIALMAGIIIIPACFAYGVKPDAGPSLLFITLPNVFQHMFGGRIWGTMFFVFMSFAALSTVIAVFENIIAMTVDLLGWERKKALLVNLVGIFLLSIPAVLGYNIWSGVQIMGSGTTIMDFEDFLVSYNILPLGSLLVVLFCTRDNGWGFDNFVEEVDTGVGRKFPRGIRNYMKYVLPLIILVIYFKGYYDTFAPKGIKVLGIWMTVAVLLVALILYCASGKGKKKKASDQ